MKFIKAPNLLNEIAKLQPEPLLPDGFDNLIIQNLRIQNQKYHLLLNSISFQEAETASVLIEVAPAQNDSDINEHRQRSEQNHLPPYQKHAQSSV